MFARAFFAFVDGYGQLILLAHGICGAVALMRECERQGDGTWADGLLMELLATDM